MIRSAIRPMVRPAVRPAIGWSFGSGQDPRAAVIAALFGGGEQGIFVDPSDDGLLFQSRTAQTNPAGDTDPVGTAVGAEGLDSMTAPNDGARPVRQLDGSLWSIHADGIDDWIRTGTDYVITPTWYFAIAFKTVPEEVSSFFGIGGQTANDYFSVRSDSRSGNNNLAAATRGDGIGFEGVSGGDLDPSGWNVAEFLVEAGTSTLWLGGVQIDQAANSWTTSNEVSGARIEMFARGGSINENELSGGLAIAVNRAPTASERQIILDLMTERGYM